jgi:hypothetical protein
MENSLDVLERELIPTLGDSSQNLFFALKTRSFIFDFKIPKSQKSHGLRSGE